MQWGIVVMFVLRTGRGEHAEASHDLQSKHLFTKVKFHEVHQTLDGDIYIYIKVRVLLSGYVQIQCVFYLTGNKKHSKRYQVRKNSVCQ